MFKFSLETPVLISNKGIKLDIKYHATVHHFESWWGFLPIFMDAEGHTTTSSLCK